MASTRPTDEELLRLLADHRPGDVAAKLGVPAGTVRQWKNRLAKAGHQLPKWNPGPPKRAKEAAMRAALDADPDDRPHTIAGRGRVARTRRSNA